MSSYLSGTAILARSDDTKCLQGIAMKVYKHPIVPQDTSLNRIRRPHSIRRFDKGFVSVDYNSATKVGQVANTWTWENKLHEHIAASRDLN